MDEYEIQCPYCGETITLFLDSGGQNTQEMVSDCDVCCRPIRLHCAWGEEGELTRVDARRDGDGHF